MISLRARACRDRLVGARRARCGARLVLILPLFTRHTGAPVRPCVPSAAAAVGEGVTLRRG
eukprot:1199090-Rhodomonas_salina.1